MYMWACILALQFQFIAFFNIFIKFSEIFDIIKVNSAIFSPKLQGIFLSLSLFPTMPRHNLHKAAPLVKSLCKKHGLDYQSKTLFTAFADIIGYVVLVDMAFYLDCLVNSLSKQPTTTN